METEKQKPQIQEKKSFNFVDTIRCISMFGIVFEQSAILWGIRYGNTGDLYLQVVISK